MRLRFLLLALAALAAPALRGAAPAGEPLAGEQDEAAPKPKPTVGGDEGAPTPVSRRPQAAPAFTLPEFVITGSGERKAVARRPDLSTAVDTSGGLKASPGEEGASKAALGAAVRRETLEGATYSARPAYGQLRAAYGLANTLDLRALWGEERGAWSYLLRGGHASSDGGPLSGQARTFHQNSQDEVDGRTQWDLGGSGSIEAELHGDWSKRYLTRSSLPAPRLERHRGSVGLAWEGKAAGTWLRAGVEGASAFSLVPGLGLAVKEEGGGLWLQASRVLAGRTSRALLEADLRQESLAQAGAGSRQAYPGEGSFRSRLKPWDGARLSLGLKALWSAGDLQDFVLGPLFDFEQRLGEGAGFFARTAPSLELSRLKGLRPEEDVVLPDNRLRASKRVLDAEAGVNAAPWPELALELAVTARQNEDHFLADDPAAQGLWVHRPVRQMRRVGLEARQRFDGGAWWQEASVAWQQAELPDLPGAKATFVPAWAGALKAGARSGRWSGWVEGRYVGERAAQLTGSWQAPAYVDLSAELGWLWRESVTLFVEGRNLLAQPLEPFPDYSAPAPYAGLGAWMRF